MKKPLAHAGTALRWEPERKERLCFCVLLGVCLYCFLLMLFLQWFEAPGVLLLLDCQWIAADAVAVAVAAAYADSSTPTLRLFIPSSCSSSSSKPTNTYIFLYGHPTNTNRLNDLNTGLLGPLERPFGLLAKQNNKLFLLKNHCKPNLPQTSYSLVLKCREFWLLLICVLGLCKAPEFVNARSLQPQTCCFFLTHPLPFPLDAQLQSPFLTLCIKHKLLKNKCFTKSLKPKPNLHYNLLHFLTSSVDDGGHCSLLSWFYCLCWGYIFYDPKTFLQKQKM